MSEFVVVVVVPYEYGRVRERESLSTHETKLSGMDE